MMLGRGVLLFICFCFFGQAFSASRKVEKKLSILEYLYSLPGKDSLQCIPGVFNTYIKDNRYYWEIPDSLQEREFMVATVIAKGADWEKRPLNLKYGYGGDQIGGPSMIQFKENGSKMSVLASFRVCLPADTSNFLYPLASSQVEKAEIFELDVKVRGNHSVLVDVTSLLKSSFFSLEPFYIIRLGRYMPDKSYVKEIKGLSENIIIRWVQSYQEKSDPSLSTCWEISFSVCLLPKEPFRPRYADKRVNYFRFGFQDLNLSAVHPRQNSLIWRWRLEPKVEDIERYKKGELVVPKKPIIFYIDKETPANLVPHFVKAVNVWQKVFEKAGFKEAIEARREPSFEENPDFSPDDIRFCYISYKPSSIANAYGSSMVDPRSGEILSARIGVFAGVFQLVQNWYFIQCGLSDSRVREVIYPDSLLGRLVEFAITHEVGHTLGLSHNFIGSDAFTVEQIRDKNFVRKNGFGTSIMDYVRFNYVAQPEDGFSPADLIPYVGVQDEFAIEWGYRYFPDMTLAEEWKYLSSWVNQNMTDPLLRFGAEDSNDPRCQAEDLTNEPTKANTLAMENMKKLLCMDEIWRPKDHMESSILKNRYKAMVSQYCIWVEQVALNIGTRYFQATSYQVDGHLYRPVPRERQEQAMAFLDAYYFTYPDWLLRSDVMKELGVSFQEMTVLYRNLMEVCMSQIGFVADNELFPRVDTYSADEYLAALHNSVLGKWQNKKDLAYFELEILRQYVQQLKEMAEDFWRKKPLLAMKLRNELRLVEKEMNQRIEVLSKERDRLAFIGLTQGINDWLDRN